MSSHTVLVNRPFTYHRALAGRSQLVSNGCLSKKAAHRRHLGVRSSLRILAAVSLLLLTVRASIATAVDLEREDSTHHVEEGWTVNGYEATTQCRRSPLDSEVVDPSSYEFGCGDIKTMLEGDKELLSHGTMKEAYLVKYEGRLLALRSPTPRMLKSPRQIELLDKRETIALYAVRDHPNIVPLLGYCDGTAISEFCPVQVVSISLRNEMSVNSTIVMREESVDVPMGKIVRMSLDAARGLEALHEVEGGPIVHFDLKPDQLMLDESRTLRIGDFNLARFMSTDANGVPCPITKYTKANGIWKAPEQYTGDQGLTEKVDIYALSMVFWTFLAGRRPFSVIHGHRDADSVLAGVRPTIEDTWPRDFVELMKEMWNQDPTKRPAAREIVDRLEQMQDM